RIPSAPVPLTAVTRPWALYSASVVICSTRCLRDVAPANLPHLDAAMRIAPRHIGRLSLPLLALPLCAALLSAQGRAGRRATTSEAATTSPCRRAIRV